MKEKILLDIKMLNITCGVENKTIPLLDGVSFTIKQGELVALVGESGSGKSITALSILQLLRKNCYVSGQALFNGRDLLALPEPQMEMIRGNDIAIIFQEPMTALNPLHTIEKQIKEAIQIHQPLSKRARHKRCLELLEQVELTELSDRLNAYPHMLSGGQRQRVMIAMALANNPKLLIADEPTTALDANVQQSILTLLKKLQKEQGLSVLLITHDLSIVKRIADHVCVLHQGKLVESNTTKAIFSKPKEDYTKKLVGSYPSGSPYCVKKNAKITLETQNLSVDFALKKNFFGKPISLLHALQQIKIQVKQGETLGIVGESGSGKSTLAMAILRLIHSKGSVIFNGENLEEKSGKMLTPLRKEMQIVFQDPFASLNPRMMIGDIVAEGLKVHFPQLSPDQREQKVLETLKKVSLHGENLLSRYPHEFSGGQRQRIAIARAIILEPKLLIFDEPTSALDVTTQSVIIDLLRNLQREYQLSYIFISHDLRVVRAMSHRVAILRHGEIIEYADTEVLFSKPQSQYTKELLLASGFQISA